MAEVSLRVDRRLVHRALDSEVFVTGFAPESSDTWRCAVHVPRTHTRLVNARCSVLPIIVGLELQRQCGYVAAHQLGVPFGWRFVILEFSVRWVGAGPTLSEAGFSGAVSVRARVTQWWQQKPRRIEYHFSIVGAGGEAVGSGVGVALCLEPSRYTVMRQRSAAASQSLAAPPGTVGPADLVQWDNQDRFLFNRPDDHVVSMALIDDFLRRVASIDRRGAVTGIDTWFHGFGESSRPIHLSLSVVKNDRVEGVFLQDDRVIARAAATMS